jgi:hypothetical protein
LCLHRRKVKPTVSDKISTLWVVFDLRTLHDAPQDLLRQQNFN